MKILLTIFILLTITLSYPGSSSGMYFNDGFTLFGKYITQKEGDKSSGIGLGFSYLSPQEAINSTDRPTLFQSGTFEINGLYASVDNDGLDMQILSMGLGYYKNNIKIGFYYETLYDYSGEEVDQLNDWTNNTLDMSSNFQMLSIGSYKNVQIVNVDFVAFLNLMRTEGEVTMSYIFAGEEVNIENDGGATLLQLGLGYKIDNLVIQPTVTINEDKEKRYSVNFLFNL